ncbi:MAG: APC family permease [Ignavibacteriales bacterium]
MGNSNSTGSSKGSLGKIAALLLTAGMMVGTGIFTTLGVATSKAQSGILIAMLIGCVIVLMTGISAAQAGVNYPEEGGAFIWMRIFGNPTISFAAGISYLIKGIVGLGIAALGFAHYSSQMFHGLPIPLMASIAILVVAAVNFFGITPTANAIISIFFINLILLIVYVGFSIPSVKVQNLSPVFGPGITGILSGAAAFFWSWDGFQRTAIMANEIKNPRRSIPFAIIGGILIAAIIYTIVAGVTLGVLGANAMGKSDTPLFLGATKATAGWGIYIILLSAWILAFSDILGDLMSTSKVGHAMGQEHELPYLLGTVHKRLKTPQFAILLLTIVGLALVNLVPLRQLVPVASTCTLIWYIITNLAALKVTKENRITWPIISWLGIVACITLLFSLPLWSVAGAIVLIVVLTGIRWLLILVNQKAGVDASGDWAVSGLKLAEGDIISVTAQYPSETISTKTTAIVAEAPPQTSAPVISRAITDADSAVSGKAPSGSNVILSINNVAQTAVSADGGNWKVSGLDLSQGDIISVTAQSVGKRVSTAVIITVVPAPIQTAEPIISGKVTAADKTVSGKAPSGTNVVLNVNGKAQPAVVANGGNWTVSDLKLSQGDSLSVNAEYAGETVNTETIKIVTPKPLQTAEPIISGKVTAANTSISGKAPAGSSVVVSVNGVALPAVIAADGKTLYMVEVSAVPTPIQTAAPVISGIVTAGATTVSGTAPAGSNVVFSVNGMAQLAIVDTNGNWIVSGLILSQGDTISVAAQSVGETVSVATTITVQ